MNLAKRSLRNLGAKYSVSKLDEEVRRLITEEGMRPDGFEFR